MNVGIRIALAAHNFKQWQLAKYLHISEGELSRRLSRKELSDDETNEFLQAIDQMAKSHNQPQTNTKKI